MTYMQLDEGRREQGDTGGAARADDGDDGGGSLGEQSRAAWLFYSGYKKLIRSREEEIFSRQDVLPLAHTAWPLKLLSWTLPRNGNCRRSSLHSRPSCQKCPPSAASSTSKVFTLPPEQGTSHTNSKSALSPPTFPILVRRVARLTTRL